MSRDRRPVDIADRQALAAAVAGMRELTREIRLFAEDSTLPGGDRVHARAYLRKMICRRLRELDARIDAITPRDSAPETKPGGEP